jgi:enamine deaminase RidA (YjgF/YER057c/UK114 family)
MTTDFPLPQVIDLPAFPVAGLYSNAVAAPVGTQLLTIAGQLAVDDQGLPAGGDFAAQFAAVVNAIDGILREVGADLRAVCKFTTYLIDTDDIAKFYEERAKMWPRWWPEGRPPGNTLLVVQRLVRPEFRIEIEALAAIPPLKEGPRG